MLGIKGYEAQGRKTTELFSESSLDLNSFERIFDSTTNSYKIYWFLGLFKEITLKNNIISFRRVILRMVTEAWYSVTQYNLLLGFSDNLYNLVKLIHKKYDVDVNMTETNLINFLENINDIEVEKYIKDLMKYVPYRLLTPFYLLELSKIKKDYLINKAVVELTQIDNRSIYKIDDENKIIIINKQWFDFIYNNQNLVYGWINYKLICYLQKRNPNVPAIPFKIKAPLKRNLNIAKKLWNSIKKEILLLDIYTEKELCDYNFKLYGNLSIDHFIPWSFVLHDELWNLVPTFSKINSSKNNKLPNLTLYLNKFCDIQFKFFNVMQKNYKKYKSNLEEYTSINICVNNKNFITRDEFTNKLKANIEPLYQIAYNKGYDIWSKE